MIPRACISELFGYLTMELVALCCLAVYSVPELVMLFFLSGTSPVCWDASDMVVPSSLVCVRR